MAVALRATSDGRILLEMEKSCIKEKTDELLRYLPSASIAFFQIYPNKERAFRIPDNLGYGT